MLLMRGITITLFSVGLEGSPDLAAAQIVADHIGTIHHEIKFTSKKV
jgi:asparagine synthetase B (glutamine-hydrolysing)